MNRNQAGLQHPNYTLLEGQYREIGLRAVAAAVLYAGSTGERTISRELPVPAAAATPSAIDKP